MGTTQNPVQAVAYGHLLNDAESMRTTALVSTGKAEALLSNGLNAIRAGHVQTATEYITRANAAIKEANELLRNTTWGE